MAPGSRDVRSQALNNTAVRNLVTDYQGHYACIDYEASRCFEGVSEPRILIERGTELPPEMERGEGGDPFAADVWAMGILFLRALHVSLQPHLS